MDIIKLSVAMLNTLIEKIAVHEAELSNQQQIDVTNEIIAAFTEIK